MATKTRVITDLSGNLQMIINPDDDAQLDNVPEFSPKNSLIVDLQKTDYQAIKGSRDFLALLQPELNTKNRNIGILYQAKIDAIDMAAAIDAEVKAAAEKLDAAEEVVTH